MFSLQQNSYVLLSIVETNENLYSVHHVSECKDSTDSGYIFPLTLLFMAAEAIKRGNMSICKLYLNGTSHTTTTFSISFPPYQGPQP